MGKSLLVGALLAVSSLSFATRLTDGKDFASAAILREYPYIAPGDDSLLAPNEFSSTRSVTALVTAYTSSEDETDSTPYITASNTFTRDGIVAANWLPFGTKVRIPAVFGNKVFTVEDRMHPKNDEKLDVWFSTKEEAFKFGVQKTRIEIL